MIDLTGVPELDHAQSPYFQAFKRMEDNKPPYPTALLESLGAYIGKEWTRQSKPSFRGWIGAIGDRFDLWDWMAIPNDVDLDDIGYAGIWRVLTASKTHIIWCSLPSMLHGEIKPGETFFAGPDRVKIGWKQEDLDAMVRQGYEIMMQMIAERGEYRDES